MDEHIVSGVEPTQTVNNADIALLLKRVAIFLADGNWSKADEYCERVLDLDPECAQAYVYKLMAERHICEEEQLGEQTKPFGNNGNFLKAMRFGDDALKSTLMDYAESSNVCTKNRFKKWKINKKLLLIIIAAVAAVAVVAAVLFVLLQPVLRYRNAATAMEAGEYVQAQQLLQQLDGYKDSDELLVACNYALAQEMLAAGNFTDALTAFQQLEGYGDSADQIVRCNYDAAVAALEMGQYVEAIAMFEALDGYENSAEMIIECQYRNAIKLMQSGEIMEAKNVFETLDGYSDSEERIIKCRRGLLGEKTWSAIQNAKVGDTFAFGTYEQDNNTANGSEEIEWRVLARDGSRVLVVSVYALDCQRYNTTFTDVTWETCTLRKWLNEDFLNAAFSSWEQEMIPTVTVAADRNTSYKTSPGNATEDQIFLLSIAEANKYFRVDGVRKCWPTAYAISKGAWTSDDGNCYWWLRTPGDTQADASAIYGRGGIHNGGNDVDNNENAVRPAMWIELEN